MQAQGKPASANLIHWAKIYLLNHVVGKWDHHGTGNVIIDNLKGSEAFGLFVIDKEQNEVLLWRHIRHGGVYRRLEDTEISWYDPVFSTELALRFQESTGCSYIWEQICSLQRNHEMYKCPATERLDASGSSQAEAADETFFGSNSKLESSPLAVEENNIDHRMHVTEFILRDHDFFRKLMHLFKIFEDLENLEGLRMIFRLVKRIILLNSPQIFEKIFGDELFLDIIGCLEYDPDGPCVQHHRAFLKEHVVFEEAIPIKDSVVLSKVHQTYRIGYLKDVILPRALDEATVANLNYLIHSNNEVVVCLLKHDKNFIHELFVRMKSETTSAESKKNLIFFLHDLCISSKALEQAQQLLLIRDFIDQGIFDIICNAMQSEDNRLVLVGVDILNLFMTRDPDLLRSYFVQQEENSLLKILVKGMISDFGDGMHCQFPSILRSLMDSNSASGSQKHIIVDIFYRNHLGQLTDLIMQACHQEGPSQLIDKSVSSGGVKNQVIKPEILLNICELLHFCVLHHPCRIKCNILVNNVIDKVLFLTHRREKYIVAAAIRFLRAIISYNEEYMLCYIVKKNLLKPIVEAFVCNGNRNNLLSSTVLELFQYIRKENLNVLILYLIDTFWTQLAKFRHLAPIHALKVKNEQLKENSKMRGIIDLFNLGKQTEAFENNFLYRGSNENYPPCLCGSPDGGKQAQSIFDDEPAFSHLILSTGSGSGTLVDYNDDDDSEEELERMLETSSGTDRAGDASSKLKREMISEEGFGQTKKHRMDKKISEEDGVFPVCSRKIHASTHTPK